MSSFERLPEPKIDHWNARIFCSFLLVRIAVQNASADNPPPANGPHHAHRPPKTAGFRPKVSAAAFFVPSNDEFSFNYVMCMPNYMHNQRIEFLVYRFWMERKFRQEADVTVIGLVMLKRLESCWSWRCTWLFSGSFSLELGEHTKWIVKGKG